MTPTLTRTAFVAWLATWQDDAIIGYSHSGGACPVAAFIHDSGMPDATVTEDEIQPHGQYFSSRDAFTAPTWVINFVEAVDGGLYDHAINAGTALEILAGIPEEATQ